MKNKIKQFKRFINRKITTLNKYDMIIFILIILFCSFFSLKKIGNINAPNTFYRFENENIIIDLKNNYDVNKIAIYNGEKESSYDIYISEDNKNYDLVIDNKCSDVFSWDFTELNYNKKRYIKITYYDKASIGEIGIYSNNKLINNTFISNGKRMLKYLNDEQKYVPIRKSYMNSTYFDEIYFARTAYEYVYNLEIYEWTHPPLGKIIQAIPIYITKKMTPFNYRLMGCISGILLVGVMYIFGTLLFKKRKYGLMTAIIMILDTFRFAQTRMGTVDSHLVLFTTLSILFMYIFTEKKLIKYLIFSGIFFGLSICIKWTGLLVGIALALIYFYTLIKNKLLNYKYIIYGTLFFVLIPLTLYIVVFLKFDNNLYRTNTISNIIKMNKEMYNYHSNLKEKHFFSSKWYTWPISYKPVWYHQIDTKDNYQETISGIGNIVIWISSVIGTIYLLLILIIKKEEKALILIICIISLWLPYAFINRIMYLYHFFPVLPIFFMSSIYFYKDLEEIYKIKKVFIAYILLSLLFFLLYYPVVSGREISDNYINSIRVLKSWYF